MSILRKVILGCIFCVAAQAKFFLGIEGGYSLERVNMSGTIELTGYNPYQFYTLNTTMDGIKVGINFGTEHFSRFFGFRWMLNLGFGNNGTLRGIRSEISGLNTQIEDIYHTSLSGSLDLFFTPISSDKFSLGIFGGITPEILKAHFKTRDVNYQDLTLTLSGLKVNGADFRASKSLYGFNGSHLFLNTYWRVGISLMLNGRHRLEFYASIPIFKPEIVRGDNFAFTTIEKFENHYSFYMMGYKFVF